MNTYYCKILFAYLVVTFPFSLSAPANHRLFVLTENQQVLLFQLGDQGAAKLVRTYDSKELAGVAQIQALEVKEGNILEVYSRDRTEAARFLYRPESDSLEPYGGLRGDPASFAGRLLDTPALDEPFRQGSSLYSKTVQDSYPKRQLLDTFKKATAGRYQDIFALENQIFGIAGDRIDRLHAEKGPQIDVVAEEALMLAGSDLTAAAVSPWMEVFLSDAATNSIRRLRLSRGRLETSGSLTGEHLASPGRLAFSMDGQLFVANREKGSYGILRYEFVLDGFTSWRGVPREGIGLDGAAAKDLALARPVGFILSEKETPAIKLDTGAAGGHFGISQVVFVSPTTNSEAAIIALVEYEPGGFTPVHYHSQMEQAEVVLAGRAIWEVGEFEREVGPGDVIFCPRNVKHGYKVLGDSPFKFLQLEWRDLGK